MAAFLDLSIENSEEFLSNLVSSKTVTSYVGANPLYWCGGSITVDLVILIYRYSSAFRPPDEKTGSTAFVLLTEEAKDPPNDDGV
ncbi:hypothetical protein OUZ56_015865 [Daphnia magna]|uniref:Uncharacterized protein n=1 Tax=Daphnia magna TaxID=35525 RepID=A0ABR0ANZ8_9CRUS|nr:hypothetical protein OUZ56_015865 [Daphnia magna]